MEKGTNVRFPIERLLGAALRGLEAVAPPLAERLAEELFFTPQRTPLAAGAAQVLAGARRFRVPFRSGSIAAWRWGTGPEPVLLVHGWSSRAAHLTSFVDPLAALGVSVVAFDGPGHGASPGRRSSIPELAEAVRAVSHETGPIRAIVAHSLGGPASLYAVKLGAKVSRLALLAPACEPRLYARRFAERLGLSAATEDGLRARTERRLGIRFEDLDARLLVRELAQPLLVVHDRGDQEVPWDEGERIASAAPRAELVTTEGLGHRRLLRDPRVVERTVRFAAEAARTPDLGVEGRQAAHAAS